MRYFLITILSLSTLQYFGMAVVNKSMVLFFLFIMPLCFLLYKRFLLSPDLKFEVILGFIFLSFNMLSLITNNIGLSAAIISLQFPLIFFLISISAPSLFLKINYNFDELVSTCTKVLFYSWVVFSTLGIIFLNDNLWWYDQGVPRLKGALGVAPSSILNTLIFISSFYLFFLRKNKIFLSILILSFIFVLLSGTRSSLVACLVAVISMLFLSNIKNKFYYISSFLPILAYFIYQKVISRLVHSGAVFTGFDSVNFNGRLYLWEQLLTRRDNIYFGHGAGASVEVLKRYAVGVGVQPHNDYIRVLFDLGLIGLILLLTLLLVMFLKLFKRLNKNYYKDNNSQYVLVISLLIAFICMMITDNLYIYVFFFFPMLLYYFHIITTNQFNRGN